MNNPLKYVALGAVVFGATCKGEEEHDHKETAASTRAFVCPLYFRAATTPDLTPIGFDGYRLGYVAGIGR